MTEEQLYYRIEKLLQKNKLKTIHETKFYHGKFLVVFLCFLCAISFVLWLIGNY